MKRLLFVAALLVSPLVHAQGLSYNYEQASLHHRRHRCGRH